ncbi:MAG: type II secretion system F family protein [Candidatus Pacearchaeota archaeon]
MSFELFKKNLEQEKILLERIKFLHDRYENITLFPENRKNLENAINSAERQIRILNSSIPKLLENLKIFKELPSYLKQPTFKIKGSDSIVTVSHNIEGLQNKVAIKRKDKSEYMNQLHISEFSLSQLRKKEKKDEVIVNDYKKPNLYLKISNKLFFNYSKKMIESGYYQKLGLDLRKGNFTTLLSTYVSMMLLTTLISIVIGFFFFVFFIFFNISLEAPYFYLIDYSSTSLIKRFFQIIWFIPGIPILTYLVLYFYPSAERASIESEIEYELPFVTIQMAAIAGADIEPSNIFRIIAMSKEYDALRNESKKLMNQINLYGYDLLTALNNVSRSSPSKGWSDLLNGMATTIRSGGSLTKYLQKKSESLLFEYRLKREKATRSAETFMDIYISVVIAAPMLMMILLIIISISNIGFSLTLPIITLLMVTIVGTINILFLVFLHLSQKKI